MKTIILSTLLAAAPILVAAQQTFKVSGTVKNLPDQCVVQLINNEGMEPKVLANDTTSNDAFSLSGTFKGPRMCTLKFFKPTGKEERPYLSIGSLRLLVDSQPQTVEADANNFKDRLQVDYQSQAVIHGSEEALHYQQFLNVTRQAELLKDSLSYVAAKAWFDHSGDDEAIKKEHEDETRSKNEYLKTVNDFIEAHPTYAVSAAIVAQRFFESYTYTQDQMKHWIDITSQSADTMHVNFMKRNYNVEMNLCLGADFHEVNAMQKDGQVGKVSALRQPGKYLLMDFWASWCGPCRAAIPKVKKMSEDFADKLQVVSISVDEKKEAWQKAEKEEAMPWPQLWLNKEQMRRTAMDYSISSIPKLVLINPEGKITLVTHDPKIIPAKIK
ncbi:MAG: thioredoxin-like domain-containing protein [Prevotella sp.]|jgi:thiol-disulfide isomerase/thioredoxin